MKYSEGFNPRPKFSIANPLSLGIESEAEYIDIELEKDMPLDEFVTRMNDGLPKDIQILKAVSLEKANSVSSMIEWAFYEIKFQVLDNIELSSLQEKIESWRNFEEIMITKMKKKGREKVPAEVNIKSLIGNIIVKGKDDEEFIILNALLKSGDNGNLKPIDFTEAIKRVLDINIDMDSIMVRRLAQYAEKNGNIYSPL